MQIVGTRFRGGENNAGVRHAEFGVIVLRGDFGLGHGIEHRIDDDDAEDGILVVCTIKLEAGSAEGLAIDRDLMRRLGEKDWRLTL